MTDEPVTAAKFETLYGKHVSALKRQGKAEKTIEAGRQYRGSAAALGSSHIRGENR